LTIYSLHSLEFGKKTNDMVKNMMVEENNS